MIYDKLKENKDLFLIAGPCVIESEETTRFVAEELKRICEKCNIQLIFKSSYKKANRTSINTFTGLGIDKGLDILKKIKNELSLPILTDIHETIEIEKVAEVADILQIPAFLARQTDLLVSAAATGRCINIKKAQFMAPEDMVAAVKKIESTGNCNVLVTERGTSFGYHNLVVDFRNFMIMSKTGYPVVYDVTHSLQRPSIGEQSGGTPEFALPMAKAAVATGFVNGLFIETHPNPAKALSDSATQLPLSQMAEFLDEVIAVNHRIRG